MMTLLAVSVFGLGFGIALCAIVGTVIPYLGRIGEALAGRVPVAVSPLSELVRAERRIAVKRWAAESRPRVPARLREAA